MAESNHSERRLAKLLEALPPAPSAWVEAAKELPRMRSEIDGILDRAARDTAYRESVTTAIEKALSEAPEGADRETLEALRERLGAIGDRERDDG